MNPDAPTFPIYVLYTHRVVDQADVCDAYGFTDPAAAQAEGERQAHETNLPGLTFMVLPLQAAPSGDS